MRGLIGDRFLKWFFERRSLQRKANSAGEAGIAPDKEPEKTAEPASPPAEDLPEVAPGEIGKSSETTGDLDQQDESDRPSGSTDNSFQ